MLYFFGITISGTYDKSQFLQICYCCYGAVFRLRQICQAVSRVICFINSFRCRCYIRKLNRFIFFTQAYACRIDRSAVCIRCTVCFRFVILTVTTLYKRITVFIHIRSWCSSFLCPFCVNSFRHFIFIYFNRKGADIILCFTGNRCQTFANKFHGLCIRHGGMILSSVRYDKSHFLQIIHGRYRSGYGMFQICQSFGRAFCRDFIRSRFYIRKLHRRIFFS